VLNLRLAVDMDTSDVGVSNLPWLFDLLDRIPDTGVMIPEGVGFGLAPGLVCNECLRGGLADLSFTERSRHMLLLTSEDGFALLGAEMVGGSPAATFPLLADRSG
jgi:hypothetical protein